MEQSPKFCKGDIMWIFKEDDKKLEVYQVGYFIMCSAYEEDYSGSYQQFEPMYRNLTLEEAERKVNYLNGGHREFAV